MSDRFGLHFQRRTLAAAAGDDSAEAVATQLAIPKFRPEETKSLKATLKQVFGRKLANDPMIYGYGWNCFLK
jgi:hypothetical protein